MIENRSLRDLGQMLSELDSTGGILGDERVRVRRQQRSEGVHGDRLAQAFPQLSLGPPRECFRFRVVGHYFALVTLALGEVIRLIVTAERNVTGGSLGMTLTRTARDSVWAIQFTRREAWYSVT